MNSKNSHSSCDPTLILGHELWVSFTTRGPIPKCLRQALGGLWIAVCHSEQWDTL